MIGTKLGHFEIIAKLGAGGMGEVWRARDTRLGREVAVKLLPGEVATDAERLRRFEQEARAASALNHANVLTIYDVGSHEGRPFLVTEVLEGRSLRDLLDAEGTVPAARALEWSAQVTAGLAAAHAQGIVHRDLKPENLFVCADGRIKILDFGLAKLTLPSGGSRSMVQEASTVTELTQERTLLGTVGYMAPEQARGEAADARADLFAVGCVLIEMLSGERAFRGTSPIEILSAILNSEPAALSTDPTLVRRPALVRALARCLAKDPAARWQCAGDLGAELERLAREPEPATPAADGGVVRLRLLRTKTLALAAGALVAGLAVGFLAHGVARSKAATASLPLTRFALEPPAGHTFNVYGTASGPAGPAVSPDGRSIVFAAADAAQSTLWLQRLDAVSAVELPGTAGASLPFFSPDGAEVAFLADGKLKRIVLATGAVHVVCDASFSLGGTWTSGGLILFAPGPGQPIWSVPALGGTAAPVTKLGEKEFIQAWPEALPGGDRFLFDTIIFDPKSPANAWTVRLRAATIDGASLRIDEVLSPGRVRFIPPDRLLLMKDDALVARRFDPDSLRFAGEPAVLAEPVFHMKSRGDALFGVGADVLVYEEVSERTALTWYDRRGQRQQTVAEPGSFWSFTLSADDATVLYPRFNVESGALEIWRADTLRGGALPLMHGSGWSWSPVFSPDGTRFVFESTRLGPPDFFVQSLKTGSEPELLRHMGGLKYPIDWTPDGKRILMQYQVPPGPFGTWTIDAEGRTEPKPLVDDLGETSGARVAPTGDLLAVSAKVSERWQVYVQRYPDGGDRILVPGTGGVQPTWRGDGRELYYVGPDSFLYAVPIVRQPRLEAGRPVRLFHLPLLGPLNFYQDYQSARDGQRFLVNALVEGRGAPAHVVLGWRSLLGER